MCNNEFYYYYHWMMVVFKLFNVWIIYQTLFNVYNEFEFQNKMGVSHVTLECIMLLHPYKAYYSCEHTDSLKIEFKYFY